MFKKRAGVFYRVKTTRRSRMVLVRRDKTRAASFFEPLQKHSGLEKRVSKEFKLCFCERCKLAYEKNIRY